MLSLLKRQTIELAGLDIGTSAVKLVQLSKAEHGYKLVNAVVEPVAVCLDDQDQYRKNTIKSIRSCLQKTGLKSKSLVCGVCGSDVVVRGFTFPPLPDQAVEQAVRMEAQQVCPLDLDKSALDYQLIEIPQQEEIGKARPRAGVMAVATEKMLQDRTSLLAEADTKAIMMDANALALLNCLNELQLANAEETVAIIDIGGAMSNIVIYGQDGLPFVRDINIAGDQIAGQIAEELQISAEQVWQTLSMQPEQADRKLLLALNNAIVQLATAINETLRFYSFQEKKSGVDRILLCGGFALIGPFIEFLTDALSIPVSVMNPFSKINCSDSQSIQSVIENGPVFAVAAGLAMRNI